MKTLWETADPLDPPDLTKRERAALWRRALPFGIIAMLLVNPPSVVDAHPYGALALYAFVLGLAISFLSKPVSAALGRRKRLQNDIHAPLIIPGRRLGDGVAFFSALAILPLLLLWALEERHTTVLQSLFMGGFFWLVTGFLAFCALECLRGLLRADNAIRADAYGITCPELWHSVIPWNRIAGIRTDGTGDDAALMIVFDAALDVELVRRWRLSWKAKLDAERHALTIPDALLGPAAEDVATLLQDRLRQAQASA